MAILYISADSAAIDVDYGDINAWYATYAAAAAVVPTYADFALEIGETAGTVAVVLRIDFALTATATSSGSSEFRRIKRPGSEGWSVSDGRATMALRQHVSASGSSTSSGSIAPLRIITHISVSGTSTSSGSVSVVFVAELASAPWEARYRYFTVDLLSNQLLSEIPFQGVSWARAVRRAGAFSGSIPVIDATAHLDLYNSTMPGKTALYVVRNDKCVWGGLIWSREYDPVDRKLEISGAEFISYFYHRFVWKTLVDRSSGSPVSLYSMESPIQIGSYALADGVATITTRPIDLGEGSQARPHLLGAGDNIIILGTGQPDIDGGQSVYQVLNDTTFTVLVDSDDTIATTETTLATFRKSIDNYRFVRDIVKRVADDFAGVEIPRDEYLPTSTETFSIIGKQRVDGVARLTFDRVHTMVPGQEIVIKDVDEDFDGIYNITSIPSENSFEYENAGPALDDTPEDGLRTLDIAAFSVVGKKVTITTAVDHNASIGDEVVVDGGRPRGTKGVTGKDMDVFDETAEIDSVPATNKLTYTREIYGNSYWYFQRNITKCGIDYTASPDKWTVTLQVDAAHNYLASGKVKVQGLGLPYDGEHEILGVPTPTRVTYTIDRSRKIVRKSSRGGVITMYTSKPHGFKIGETVTITGYGDPVSKGYNGSWKIDTTPSANRFTFKKRLTATKKITFDKSERVVNIVGGDDTSGLVVGMKVSTRAGIPADAEIDSIDAGAKTVTLTKKTTSQVSRITTTGTAADESQVITVASTKGIAAGMLVSGTGVPDNTIVSSVDTKNKKVRISEDMTQAITNSTVRFDTTANFTLEYPDKAGNETDPPSTANAKITSDLALDNIKVSRDEIITQTDTIEIKGGGKVTLGPRAYVGSYGGFGNNSDIDIDFIEETNAGVFTRRDIFIGSDLQSVGDILEEVSAGPDGFEYRIDCDFDPTTGTFTRKFTLAGYDYPDDPEPGEVRSIASLGADKYVFDYPGNIASFSLEESAENAATRMWVTGSNSGIGGEGTKQPMAGASARKHLRQGWPVLDAAEQIDTENSALDLYDQATSFLNEALPPISELTVTVNGSMDPQVGTYVPGDWCSLAFDDDFLRMRLASDQEPRDDIIVRKIFGFKVSVPDAHGLPESVDLELIRDVEVEEVGNQ